MSVEINVDGFTPCLVDKRTGAVVGTQFGKINKGSLTHLKKDGWLFDWTHKSLDSTDIYALRLAGDRDIQGLVALTTYARDKAVYVNLAESAPHNKGEDGMYQGVGGHLFAIAAKKSVDAGYGGFIFFDAKNTDLVRHYQKTLGAKLLGMPHKYRMVVDESAAEQLLKIYTLSE